MAAKRRWGYLIWGIAAAVIAVPEITAAVNSGALPFTTISSMVGHLERHHPWVELVVVAAIALGLFSVVRRPPGKALRGDEDGELPARTPGGRLTLRASAIGREAAEADGFDDEEAPSLFGVAAFGSLVMVAAATWAASWWWDDAHHYQPAYVLYGMLGLLWLVVPSVVALTAGADVPFPTLFRSVVNIEEWLRSRSWPTRLGPALAWFLAYAIVAGLVILLLHLTLYPYPDITHILNPKG